MRRARIIFAVFACLAADSRMARAEPPVVAPPRTNTPDAAERSSVARRPVITAVAIAPGGQQIATAGDDHAVRIWNASTGKIAHMLEEHTDWVRTLACSPDGQMLASGGDDRRIILWNLATGKKSLQLPLHSHPVYRVTFNPAGTLLAAAGFEHTVRLYDAHTGEAVQTLHGPGGDLRGAVFSPDGAELAVAGRNGQIRVWAVATGIMRLEIAAGQGRIRTLAYAPSGERLISAGEGRAISVWDAHNGELVYKFDCPAAKVLSMTVCGDDRIATGGSDNVVRIWNWQTQTEVDRLRGHTGSVAALDYDPASGILLSGSYDTTLRVWRLNAGQGQKDTARDSDDARVR